MSTTSPKPDLSDLDVPRDQLPRHIAIIMDGNGRWAQERGEPRIAGHRAGASTVREIVTTCAELGLDALTLYCFSSENWKRPIEEIEALMTLYLDYLASERQEMLDNNVRFHHIGRLDELPQEVQDATHDTREATKHCDGLNLVLAINYGSRAEIADAVRAIADDIAAGTTKPEAVNEALISDKLYTAGLPDPDLLIRTAGEMRLSNYLLWQISYAELFVTDVQWPEFDRTRLFEALRDYARRKRRFGGLDKDASA